MAKKKGLPLGTFLKRFSSETQCQEHLVSQRWQIGYICSKRGCRHGYRLSNGRYQCAQCRRQTSVTAGTVLHKTHMPLRQWFLAFYFVSQDKRGISAVQLAAMLRTTYKTVWSKISREVLPSKFCNTVAELFLLGWPACRRIASSFIL